MKVVSTVAILSVASTQVSGFSVTHHSNIVRAPTALQAVDPDLVKDVLTSTGSGDNDFTAILFGGAAVVVGAIGFSLKGVIQGAGGGDETSASASVAAVVAEPEPVDVSIPYDAASMLAFAETGLDPTTFSEFNVKYKAKTIADVTVKKMQREVKAVEAIAEKMTKDLEAFVAPPTAES